MLTPTSLRRALPSALLLASAACAHRPASAPPRPVVPVVPPAAAEVALGPRRAEPRPAAPARPAPARTFAHTPGLTWDLDVLPFEGHERVQHYVGLYTGSARGRFTEWLSRGTRYEPLVRARLREGGLPEDLYYLALVESGYDVHAVSRVGATGMWQFMPETARDVGLRLDWWVDERRDPVRATDAAVRMLRWLKGQFGGSLFVAAAAYNGGPGRVSRGELQLAANAAAHAADAAAAAALSALAGPYAAGGDAAPAPAAAVSTPATGEARFFALAEAGVIAAETRNYVPQLIAAALVGKEAGRHGIRVRQEAPLAYDEVRVPPLTPLAAVAAAGDIARADLLDLNPHLLRGVTPPGVAYTVRVPEGRGEGTEEGLAALDAGERRAFRRAVTNKREAFDALAARLDVPAALLRAYNPRLETVTRGKYRGRLTGGQAVRVPTAAVLAYARSAPAFGAPGALPAPPPEPKPAAAKRAAPERAREVATADGEVKAAGAVKPDAAEKPASTEPATKAATKPAAKSAASPEKAVAADGAAVKARGGSEKRPADERAARAPARSSGKSADGARNAKKPAARRRALSRGE